MGLRSMRVEYSEGKEVFFPGETVSGNVIIELDGEGLKMRAMYLKFSGKAKVKWQETQRIGNETQVVTYQSEEKYLRYTMELGENHRRDYGGDGKSGFLLCAGDYVFPFSVQLPETLPGSVEEELGAVRYYTKVSIDRPWAKDYHKYFFITVVGLLDLNQNPQLQNPVTLEEEKAFRKGLLRKTDAVKVQVTLPKSGFVSGETLAALIKLDNCAGKEFKECKLRLLKHVRFITRKRTRSIKYTMAKMTIAEKTNGNIEANPTVPIPPLPASGILGCNIIDVQYFAEIILDPSGAHRSIKIFIPITVGSIPFRQDFNAFGGHQYPQQQIPPQAGYQHPPQFQLPPMYGQLYPDMPPPTYASLQVGVNESSDDEGTASSVKENDKKGSNIGYQPICLTYPSMPGLPQLH